MSKEIIAMEMDPLTIFLYKLIDTANEEVILRQRLFDYQDWLEREEARELIRIRQENIERPYLPDQELFTQEPYMGIAPLYPDEPQVDFGSTVQNQIYDEDTDMELPNWNITLHCDEELDCLPTEPVSPSSDWDREQFDGGSDNDFDYIGDNINWEAE